MHIFTVDDLLKIDWGTGQVLYGRLRDLEDEQVYAWIRTPDDVHYYFILKILLQDLSDEERELVNKHWFYDESRVTVKLTIEIDAKDNNNIGLELLPPRPITPELLAEAQKRTDKIMEKFGWSR